MSQTQQISYNMTVENDTYLVTTTEYDDNGRPIDGHTDSFNSQQEAEAYIMAKDSKQTDQTTQNVSAEDTQREKPASQMTEADAVALNSDVHVAVPGESDRAVTEGERDQVEAGLHPDPSEGQPYLNDEGK